MKLPETIKSLKRAAYGLWRSCGLWHRASARRGQILIPSLLVIPSLLLFVYLIFETTKISREKIRQQFAVDSAAFIQMGDYTNLLNRSAYVNGAFPYRIFKEAYECPPSDYLQKTDGSGQVCPYDMLYAAGAFPKYINDIEGQPAQALDSMKKWQIEFDDTHRSGINNNPPSVASLFTLITKEQGTKIYIFWDPASGVYRFYAQVYTLLGQVEESQMTVFERLTENFNFFRKSFYLNANTKECTDSPQSCGDEGIASPGGYRANKLTRPHSMAMYYIDKIDFYAKVPQSGLPPYYIGHTDPPMNMPAPGLFQLAAVTASALKTIGDGYQVYQGWTAPSNYFNVDFNQDPNVLASCRGNGVNRPCVHARIASQCPALSNGNNCVWPNPTPKYQTRLYP
ncbi:MAG: hypothetical protein NTX59_01605 [Elusimicrobia bacterium]|nr:hypothetical protein [Elusimicrobiota bacterium]